jgi:hypothetical protein
MQHAGVSRITPPDSARFLTAHRFDGEQAFVIYFRRSLKYVFSRKILAAAWEGLEPQTVSSPSIREFVLMRICYCLAGG